MKETVENMTKQLAAMYSSARAIRTVDTALPGVHLLHVRRESSPAYAAIGRVEADLTDRARWGARPAVRTPVRNPEGIRVQHSRFVFLAAPMPESRDGADGILWMLVSPNNRPLGRGTAYHDTYGACRQAVMDLRANCDRVKPMETTVELTGQWTWRIDLDGEPVAVSSRSYLRARECSYNLERFLEAVPNAEVVAGTRSVRRGRRHASVVESPSRPGRELRNAG